MSTNQELLIMAQVRKSVIDYLQAELEVNTAALGAYDPNPMEDDKRDPEVKRMREFEAIKLRDRVNELTRHIRVIKLMYPDA